MRHRDLERAEELAHRLAGTTPPDPWTIVETHDELARRTGFPKHVVDLFVTREDIVGVSEWVYQSKKVFTYREYFRDGDKYEHRDVAVTRGRYGRPAGTIIARAYTRHEVRYKDRGYNHVWTTYRRITRARVVIRPESE